MTRYLTANQVIALHERSLRTFGGDSGVNDLGLLIAALTRPEASFEGFEVYPRLEKKAAALFGSLLKSRPFQDGNKRTAAAALIAFLKLNGWILTPKPGELAALTLAMSTERATEDMIATWILTRHKA
jgi:death-on-curing protein